MAYGGHIDPWQTGRRHETGLQMLRNRPAMEQLKFDRERWETMLKVLHGAFGGVKPQGGSIPEYLRQRIDMYADPNSEYGQAARTEIKRGYQQGVTAGQMGMMRSGGSVGTHVTALESNLKRQATEQMQKVNEERFKRHDEALQAAAEAEMRQREVDADLMRSRLAVYAGF